MHAQESPFAQLNRSLMVFSGLLPGEMTWGMRVDADVAYIRDMAVGVAS